MTDLEQTIADLTRLEAAATKGPWEWYGASMTDGVRHGIACEVAQLADDGFCIAGIYEPTAERDNKTVLADAELIATMRNKLPDLLRAAARAGRMEKAMEEIKPLAFVANMRNFSLILRIASAALADRNEVKP